jgi:hypothetical protein
LAWISLLLWANVSLGNPSLASAVQSIFVEKSVKSDVGEFARILILHGVYQEIFQIKSYCSRPLSSWIPSAQQVPPATRPGQGERHASTSQQASDRRWLPENSTFASWRNASLDCVDVLHWAANGTIALLSGAEHPTVLHLHMSRVVLLAPFSSIRTLALSVASLARPAVVGLEFPSKAQGLEAEKEVLRWAQRDEVWKPL